MPYMRRPYIKRKYMYQEPPLPVHMEDEYPTAGKAAMAKEKLADIPLPNEKEDMSPETSRLTTQQKPFFLSFLKNRLRIEDIILLGLILLLLQEGVEDELLLILLIYILLG